MNQNGIWFEKDIGFGSTNGSTMSLLFSIIDEGKFLKFLGIKIIFDEN